MISKTLVNNINCFTLLIDETSPVNTILSISKYFVKFPFFRLPVGIICTASLSHILALMMEINSCSITSDKACRVHHSKMKIVNFSHYKRIILLSLNLVPRMSFSVPNSNTLAALSPAAATSILPF